MIYENPDELGYSNQPPFSIAQCIDIVGGPEVAWAIDRAAMYADAGDKKRAARMREQAGYGD